MLLFLCYGNDIIIEIVHVPESFYQFKSSLWPYTWHPRNIIRSVS